MGGIKLCSVFVAGTSFRDRQALRSVDWEKAVKLAWHVRCRREPANPHDKNAIGLVLDCADGAEADIGFVPKAVNTVLAALIDGGCVLAGQVVMADRNNGEYRLLVALYLVAAPSSVTG